MSVTTCSSMDETIDLEAEATDERIVKVVTSIFESCDVDHTDSARVSKLIEHITPYMQQNVPELYELRRALDPNNTDPLINSETFHQIMVNWTMKFMEDPCQAGDAFQSIYPKDLDRISDKDLPFVSNAKKNSFGYCFIKDNENEGMLRFSSSSPYCFKDPVGGDVIEPKVLQDKIAELENRNYQLAEESRILKAQLLQTEEQNELLRDEFKEYKIATQKTIDKLQKNFMVIDKENVSMKEQICNLQTMNYGLDEKLQQAFRKESERLQRFLEMEKEMSMKEQEIMGLEQTNGQLVAQVFELECSVEHYKNDNQWLKAEKIKTETFIRQSQNVTNQSETQPDDGAPLPSTNQEQMLNNSPKVINVNTLADVVMYSSEDDDSNWGFLQNLTDHASLHTEINEALSNGTENISNLRHELEEQKKMVKQLEMEISIQQTQEFINEGSRNSLIYKNSQLESELKQKDVEIDKIRNELELLTINIEESPTVRKLKELLTAAIDERDRLCDELKVFKVQKSDSDSQTDDLLKKLEEENEDLRRKVEIIEELERDKAALKDLLNENENKYILDLTKCTHQVNQLRLEKDQLNVEFLAQMDEYRRQLVTLEQQIQSKGTRVIKISSSLTYDGSFSPEKLRKNIQELLTEKEYLMNANENLAMSFEGLSEEKKTMETELKKARTRIDELDRQIQAIVGFTVDVDEEHISDFDMPLMDDSSSTSVCSDCKNCVNMKSEISNLKARISAIRGNMGDVDKPPKFTITQKTIEKLRSKNEDLKGIRDVQSKQLQKVTEELQAVIAEKDTLQHQLKQVNGDMKTLDTRLSNIVESKNSEMATMRQANLQLIDEISRLTEQKHTLERSVEVVDADYREKLQQLEEHLHYHKENISKYAHVMKLLREKKNAIKELHKTIAKYQNRVREVEERCDALTQYNEAARKWMVERKYHLNRSTRHLVSCWYTILEKLPLRNFLQSDLDGTIRESFKNISLPVDADMISFSHQITTTVHLLDTLSMLQPPVATCVDDETKIMFNLTASGALPLTWKTSCEPDNIEHIQRNSTETHKNLSELNLDQHMDVTLDLQLYTDVSNLYEPFNDNNSNLQTNLKSRRVSEYQPPPLLSISNKCDLNEKEVVEIMPAIKHDFDLSDDNPEMLGKITEYEHKSKRVRPTKPKKELKDFQCQTIKNTAKSKRIVKHASTNTTLDENFETLEESSSSLESLESVTMNSRVIFFDRKFKLLWYCGAVAMFAFGFFLLGTLFVLFIVFNSSGFFSPLYPWEWVSFDDLVPWFLAPSQRGPPPV